ncbi:hypothetical protein EON65_09305 [archaeon]|nr:MAG: hypothetical protein EON65_09305 [archaeon]
MSDDEDAENDYNDEALRMEQEVESWKAKYKQLELKKRESELTLNKVKTEINSLRSVDKHWKDASKSVVLNMLDMQRVFSIQVEQIVSSLAVIGRTSDRIQLNATFLKKVRQVIAQLQAKIAMQDDQIVNLTSRIKMLTNELDDKTKKVERLSAGLEEEVERIVKPMREKIADCMVSIMKEKAARAQERRELADLWPERHLMPTILMKNRALSEAEKQQRVAYALQQNASLALSLEVRANVVESTMWTVKYDDYGRPFYEHAKTGETSPEPPEIMKYQPPPGRDEMGNVVTTEENDYHNWNIVTDARGKMHFVHKLTGEVSYLPPYAYKKLPRGRTKEEQVSEAATVVLSFIKEKIGKHIALKTKRREVLLNPLTPEQKRKKEKELRNMTAEELAAKEPELSEEGEALDLSLYQYDIETVEMLANLTNEEAKSAGDKDPEVFRAEQRAILQENGIRKFQEDLYEDINMVEIDFKTVSQEELRGIVECLASKEEKLEIKLEKTRSSIRDFSVLLVEKIREKEVVEAKKLSEERLARDRERKEKRNHLVAERRKMREAMAQKRREDRETAKKKAEEDAKKAAEGGYPGYDAGGKAGKSDKTGGDSNEMGNFSIEGESDQESKASDAGREGVDEEKPLLPLEDGEEEEKSEVDLNELLSDEEVEEIASKHVLGGSIDIRTDDDLETVATSALSHTMFSSLPVEENQSDFVMMPNVTSDLANFALFCGYNNLQISDSPDAYNLSYSLLAEQRDGGRKKGRAEAGRRGNEVAEDKREDDEWLTCSFFLGCNKDDLDKVKAELSKDYAQSSGM